MLVVPGLAAELTARGITGTLSASTVRRWLGQDALKPWQHRSWIFITDPEFRIKASACWTYTPAPGMASPLGEDGYVISANDKTPIQARRRCHPPATTSLHNPKLDHPLPTLGIGAVLLRSLGGWCRSERGAMQVRAVLSGAVPAGG